MAGLYLNSGLRASAAATSGSSPNTSQGGDTVTAAAFSPGATTAGSGQSSALLPGRPVGNAVALGVLALVGLIIIRQSLPN